MRGVFSPSLIRIGRKLWIFYLGTQILKLFSYKITALLSKPLNKPIFSEPAYFVNLGECIVHHSREVFFQYHSRKKPLLPKNRNSTPGCAISIIKTKAVEESCMWRISLWYFSLHMYYQFFLVSNTRFCGLNFYYWKCYFVPHFWWYWLVFAH